MMSYDERIFDVRAFESPLYASLIGGYLESRDGKIDRLAIGSSFTYGYPFAPEFAYPTAIGAVNAGVLSGDLEMSFHASLCEMRARNIRAQKLILEIPIVNEAYTLVHYSRRPMQCDEGRRASLFEFALLRPWGLQWLGMVSDPHQVRLEGPVDIKTVDPGYFVDLDEFEPFRKEFTDRLRANYTLAQQVSDEAFLFVSPIYIGGIEAAGDDPIKVRALFDIAQSACIDVAGDRCIRTDGYLDNPAFYANLTHMNITGLKQFADDTMKIVEGTPR